jgi:5-methylcytosine-specific restriction enzyme subunit McrC
MQLKPSKLTLNPDILFGTVAVGDIKYSLLTPDWNRAHLYQAIAFATGFHVSHAGVFGFTFSGSCPVEPHVGDVCVRAFTWLADQAVPPEIAEATLTSQARNWLTSHA